MKAAIGCWILGLILIGEATRAESHGWAAILSGLALVVGIAGLAAACCGGRRG